MQRNKILIEKDLLRFDFDQALVEVFLVDEPRTTIVCEYLFGQELLVVLVGISQMLEVLPSETKGCTLAVLTNQVLNSNSKVVIVDQMPS